MSRSAPRPLLLGGGLELPVCLWVPGYPGRGCAPSQGPPSGLGQDGAVTPRTPLPVAAVAQGRTEHCAMCGACRGGSHAWGLCHHCGAPGQPVSVCVKAVVMPWVPGQHQVPPAVGPVLTAVRIATAPRPSAPRQLSEGQSRVYF